MTTEQRTGQVSLAFSAEAGLLRVVRCAIAFVAERSQFSEAETLNLTQAVEQACRLIIAEQYQNRPQEMLRLRLDVFADRLEVLVEDGEMGGLPDGSPDGFLIALGVDRITQEQTAEGLYRLTLVKYHSRRARQR